MTKRRMKHQLGDVFSVKISDTELCFGRVLERPLMAFYDLKSDGTPPLEVIIAKPVLFKIWVMTAALKANGWEILGNLPLDADTAKSPRFFKQDPINGQFSIHHDHGEIPCTLDECEGLERAAVWDPEHVEDRLRDHFAGKPNKWVESMKPNPTFGKKLH